MAKSKLDPGLKYLDDCAKSGRPRREGAWTCVAEFDDSAGAGQRANVLLELEQDSNELQAALKAAGFNEHARAETVVSGDLPVRNISMLGELPGLKRVEASRTLQNELDEALPESKVAPLHQGALPRRGPGVIIGIIDFGIDFRHPSFQNADGSSRILAIWDQGLIPVIGEKSPKNYTYGVEYQREQITEALRSKHPAVAVRHIDPAPFHGTHVAGIAAGNGEPTRNGADARYVGVAPEAD